MMFPLHDSPAFRKLYPEYVEMYNQQRLPEQQVSEQQSTESPKEENSGFKMEKLGNLGEDMKKEAKLNLCAFVSPSLVMFVA
ncbi:hypothetical protein Q3G72_028603 [Acer saccharum]|nr:hypothetical protein Q3G72_028603 [Acer saccharum]